MEYKLGQSKSPVDVIDAGFRKMPVAPVTPRVCERPPLYDAKGVHLRLSSHAVELT